MKRRSPKRLLAFLTALAITGAGVFIYVATQQRQAPGLPHDMLSGIEPSPERAVAPEVSVPASPRASSHLTAPHIDLAQPQFKRGTAPLSLSPSVEWAQRHRIFQDFLSSPPGAIARWTLLGSPARFAQFVGDPAKVKKFLAHPLTRAVLSSPDLSKRLVSRPGVAEGFFTSPAMQDPRVVSALARSPILKETARTPAGRAVLEDADLINRLLLSPQAMSWFSRNPEFGKAFSELRSGR
ncbi:MAG: hypothetical protein HY549_12120 [Elusimicrobia bacterium]|nr:hypothetical protein [Elusimicrobiota bacterium]